MGYQAPWLAVALAGLTMDHMSSNGTSPNTPITFQGDFSRLAPLIVEEWPQVDPIAVEKTAGNYDLLVSLISTETEHSKVLVKKQLTELADVARSDKDITDEKQNAEIKRLRAMVDRLTARSQEVSNYVREQMLEDARGQISKNPVVALLTAIGLGFVLGFILRGLGRGRGA